MQFFFLLRGHYSVIRVHYFHSIVFFLKGKLIKKPKLSLSLKKKREPLKTVTNMGRFTSLVMEETYNELEREWYQ